MNEHSAAYSLPSSTSLSTLGFFTCIWGRVSSLRFATGGFVGILIVDNGTMIGSGSPPLTRTRQSPQRSACLKTLARFHFWSILTSTGTQGGFEYSAETNLLGVWPIWGLTFLPRNGWGAVADGAEPGRISPALSALPKPWRRGGGRVGCLIP